MKHIEEMTDEELAFAYVGGDCKAFDLLLDRTKNKIFSYILFVVRDRDLADDVFQETFVKVICRLQSGQYATTGKFCAWVMRIAHNIIMDLYRDRKTENVVEVAGGNDLSNLVAGDYLDGNVESMFVNTQIMADVRRMMDMLPAPQREVVFMRFYQQLSFKEIAEVTNVSINTALGRMRYGILNMRRMAKRHNVALQPV